MTLATLLALAGLSVCAPRPQTPDSAGAAAAVPAVHGFVARAEVSAAASSGDADGTIAVVVCLAPVDGEQTVGSYRGELKFDTAAVEVVAIQRGPAAGGMRIENGRQPGRIVFAGAAPRGFTNPLVLQVRLRPRAPRHSLPRLTLSFQELSSVDGADLSARLAVSSL